MPVSGTFLSQMERLQASIDSMGKLAGRIVGDAVASVVTKDTALARDVIRREDELDLLDDEHEEQIIQIIALNQPVARDLRMLMALLRTNTSIERVGDLATNIAQTTLRIADKPDLKPFVDIPRQYELVRSMWDDALACFASMDEPLAKELRDRDDQVDTLNEETIKQLIQISTENPSFIYQTTNFIGVSKSLERIADLSVDIADEVVYACKGEFRHARTHRHTA